MNSGFLVLFLSACVAAILGFGLFAGVAAETMQAAFFALLIVSFASLVYSRHRPV